MDLRDVSVADRRTRKSLKEIPAVVSDLDCGVRRRGERHRQRKATTMSDYMMYEIAKQRHADIIDEMRRSRTYTPRNSLGKRASATAALRQWLASVTPPLTNRGHTDLIGHTS
jgi:hypothetical protein